MRLIRTIIDSRRTGGDEDLRTSQIAAKTASGPSGPLSIPVRSMMTVSETVERKLKDFKNDLAEFTSQGTVTTSGRSMTAPKRKKVWELESESLDSDPTTVAAQPPVETKTHPDPEPMTVSAPEPDVSEPDLMHDAAPQIEPEPEIEREVVEHKSEPRVKSQPVNVLSKIPRPMSQARYASRPLTATNLFEVPNPLKPRAAVSVSRTATRMMGFGADGPSSDLFETKEKPRTEARDFPVGWLVVIKGHGRGKSFSLHNQVSSIGRGKDQTIALTFGDDTVSRNNHAAIAYDADLNACFLGYGGKANLVRLNGRPMLSTEQLNHGDVIRVGETDLRFVSFCGDDFKWDPKDD